MTNFCFFRGASLRALTLSVSMAALVAGLLPAPALADTFTDAMEAAFNTNPRIKAQRKAAEQSNERTSQSIGAFRPTVGATYQRGKQKTSFENSEKISGDVDTKTLTLSQPLFSGGQNLYGYYAAKDRMQANWAFLSATEQEVMLDAISAYMDVVRDHSLLELSRNNVTVLEKQLQASEDRFSVGDVTRTDVAQSQARLARAKSDAIQAEGNLEIALAAFERDIGYRPENLPLAVPTEFPPLPESLEAGIELALKNNPNAVVSNFSKDAAENDSIVAIGAILPQVSLQGRINRQEGAGALGRSEAESEQLLVNVSIPIYQNGSEYSLVREAELITKQREFELLDTQDQVRESLIQAWEQHETAIATIKAQQEQVEASLTALDGVRQENQFGSRSVLDVLDAEQELFLANINLVRAQRERHVSLFNLLLALGELTPQKMQLNVETYDPKVHYDSVKWQLIGF